MSAPQQRVGAGLNRRTFLLSLAAGGLLCAARAGLAADARAPDWSGWLLDDDNAGAIAGFGAAYRDAHPEESSPVVLSGFVDRALAAAAVGQLPADDAGLRALLQQRVRAEYAKGEVVRVDGWILSVTEARLYALVSLQANLAPPG